MARVAPAEPARALAEAAIDATSTATSAPAAANLVIRSPLRSAERFDAPFIGKVARLP
jgi:hypothetical protein